MPKRLFEMLHPMTVYGSMW